MSKVNSPTYYLSRITSEQDFEEYFLIKSEPTAVAWSGFKKKPERDTLLAHFKGLLANKDIHLYFLYDQSVGENIGYAQFNVEGDVLHWAGYSIKGKYQGKAYSRKLIVLAYDVARKASSKKITGWISENNHAAVRWATGYGTIKTQDCKKVYLEALNREDVFHLYEFDVS